MTLLVIRSVNRRGLLHEVTGVIKDYVNVEWVFVSMPSEDERVITMRLSDSLPIEAINKLMRINGVNDVWASHEAPLELVGFDRDSLRGVLSRMREGGVDVSSFLSRLGQEMGGSLAAVMMRSRYGVGDSSKPRVLEAVVNMLVAMNLVRRVENITIDPEGSRISMEFLDPLDLDTDVSFIRGYVLGAARVVFRRDYNVDAVINKVRVALMLR
ncbi:hypothetical protein [Vulcanisaeta thermophila]|uniref:hypothetical protein n=1 Tax=Vulcanisaeta thermophila TaxID=867917 RepID=UPI000853AC18|nr:hypothetical protein [Vulcanisaeta thermophila]